MGVLIFGLLQQDNLNVVGFESVSLVLEELQNWSLGGGGDINKDDKRGDKRDRWDKDYKSDKDYKVKGMIFFRIVVVEYVKEILKLMW